MNITAADSEGLRHAVILARCPVRAAGDTVFGMNASRVAQFANLRLETGPRLHGTESGNSHGEPVVFLHGWPDSWFSFSRVLPLLPVSFHALAVDQRGFGDPDRPVSGYTIPEMAADVIAFLDALGIERATLVGLVLIGTGFEASTLLPWGDRDALFSRVDQDRMPEAVPAARLKVYEETGHCPNWERPEQVAADIASLVL